MESGVAWNLKVGHHWRGTNPMPPVTSHAEFRDGLEVYLKNKMMGPAAGDTEVLPREGSAAPSYEYVTGTLYPQSRLTDDGEAGILTLGVVAPTRIGSMTLGIPLILIGSQVAESLLR